MSITSHDVVIGLEVHAQLETRTKLFCSCSTRFGAPPNTQACPVCLGLPGVLPVMNRRAFELALRSAVALNCEIQRFTKFDRKNYYYPDLPKNYQISQYDLPFSRNGFLEIETASGSKKIGIIRVHLEEDAGKLLHTGAGDTSLVDLNRTGVPLLEIVSKPDINSAREAYLYLTELKLLLEYLKVSNCNMEEGSLRCDANVNLHLHMDGRVVATPLVEVKNMNSFKAVEGALAYEAERQKLEFLKTGKTKADTPKSTRAWDESRGVTVLLRQKEEAYDYRYFPEPDLAPVVIDVKWLEEIRAALPELPSVRRRRFIAEYSLPAYDAGVLVQDARIADYFEGMIPSGAPPKAVSNWVMGEVMHELNEKKITIDEFPVLPPPSGVLVNMVNSGQISYTSAKEVFQEMIATGKSPRAIVEEKGLVQVSDEQALEQVVDEVFRENPKALSDYRAGKKNVLPWLVGRVMAKTRGKANPKIVTEIVTRKL